MTPRRSRLLPIVGALLLAGCGATTPSPSVPGVTVSLGPGGSCSLITDLAGVLGREPIASPTSYEVGGTERCTWVVARDPSRYVGLSIGPAANHAATIDAFGVGEPVEGLGDDARWWAAARTISVAVRDRSFQVDLQLDVADVTRDRAVALAGQVLAALGGGGAG